jgi:hypothetical protein
MYDRVVTINNTHWPEYRNPGATLVDLRMFDPDDRSANPRLVFRPEKLRELLRFCSGNNNSTLCNGHAPAPPAAIGDLRHHGQPA